MKLGVIGLPNVGKSTLFNAITKANAQAANYPFCTIEPNTGVVMVPDKKLEILGEIFHPRRTIPATVEFVDIAGLVRGASTGEGLGNKFLSHIRQVDALIHVVRFFEDENIVHVEGQLDPISDMETVELELILADIESLEKRKEKLKKIIKTGEAIYIQEAEILERMLKHLEKELAARTFIADEEEKNIIKSWHLLTIKPVIYVANISEKDIELSEKEIPLIKKIKQRAKKQEAEVLLISAQIEEEISHMQDEDKELFLKEMGLSTSGLDKMIRASYKLLGLISFFTVGDNECRAWTIKKGTKAPQAAGKIHTDFERGFIRAEVVPFLALKEQGSLVACREKGLIKSEGKEYIVKDGDVILFRFNV